MAGEEQISGFAWGIVTRNDDPIGCGRVRVRIPGYFEPEHPEWVLPMGWPGGGGLEKGSRYPTPVGAQVAVIFEYGNPDSAPVFLTGYYGLTGERPAGPSNPAFAHIEGRDPQEQVTIWEDEQFNIVITEETDNKKVSIVEKSTGSGITLNSTDGVSGKAVTMTIAANTSINIQSNGIVNIEGLTVQINGRKVVHKPGVTTI